MANVNSKHNELKNHEKVQQILRQAVNQAILNYKERHGEMPEHGFYFEFTNDMGFEEELLEVFNALIRAGKSPEEAERLAPVELERIYSIQAQFEETSFH